MCFIRATCTLGDQNFVVILLNDKILVAQGTSRPDSTSRLDITHKGQVLYIAYTCVLCVLLKINMYHDLN